MMSEAELRALEPAERARLARLLASIDRPEAFSPRQARFRTVVRVLVTVGAVVLMPWTAYLAVTLPRMVTTEHWRGAWVGFDVLLVAALGLTAWLGWHGRQLVVAGLIASGTLLVCDAWFDLMLSTGSDRWVALVMAVLVELPLAVLFLRAGIMVMGQNAKLAWTLTGHAGRRPHLWRMPMPARLVATGE